MDGVSMMGGDRIGGGHGGRARKRVNGRMNIIISHRLRMDLWSQPASDAQRLVHVFTVCLSVACLLVSSQSAWPLATQDPSILAYHTLLQGTWGLALGWPRPGHADKCVITPATGKTTRKPLVKPTVFNFLQLFVTQP